jgi:alpha-galactosidase
VPGLSDVPKIALIGAGSRVFATNIVGDILSFPELSDATVSLMDVDEGRLAKTTRAAETMVAREGLDATVESTTDRTAALDGADYVLTMFYTGWEPFEAEIRIPERYGVNQAIGNILNPSGVFATLRQLPELLDVVADMEEYCPGAPLLNYTNPMATLCWAVDEATDVDVYGLCHSVPLTAEDIASYLDLPVEELEYWVAGINHMAWFLELRHEGEDLYPRLYEKLDDPETYVKDTVRFEILRHFDAFVTESSAHMSEYVPYFRTDEDRIAELTGTHKAERMPTGYYLQQRLAWAEEDEDDDDFDPEDVAVERSDEYASRIIHSMETGQPRRLNLNVRNTPELITNLPREACVEVPCLVDGTGVHPCSVGDLPPQLAALNRTNVNAQELAVRAGLERDRAALHQAIKLDPLTAAACTLEEIHEMTEEILAANAGAYPGFEA